MGVRHDHHVARSVGVRIEADKTGFAAPDEATGSFGFVGSHAVGNGEINGCDEVAEYAAEIAGPGGESGRNARARRGVGGGDVGIAPGGPENVHRSGAAEMSI